MRSDGGKAIRRSTAFSCRDTASKAIFLNILVPSGSHVLPAIPTDLGTAAESDAFEPRLTPALRSSRDNRPRASRHCRDRTSTLVRDSGTRMAGVVGYGVTVPTGSPGLRTTCLSLAVGRMQKKYARKRRHGAATGLDSPAAHPGFRCQLPFGDAEPDGH